MKAPELLSPAGSLKTLNYAYAYGADAVYAGMPRYSLRVRNNEFGQLENLKTGIEKAHSLGKALFVAVNALPHGAKLKTFLKDVAPVVALKPDALIMADPGLIAIVRENWPEVPIHLSVQANTVNSAAVKFWQSVGISRVILSRELSLDEVEEVRQACPDVELEVFVHGALCIAYSGRCLLSGYFNHRDANQGTCTNACRWDYKVKPGEGEAGVSYIDPSQIGAESAQWEQAAEPSSGEYLIEEAGRPGEYMPIEEDEHGTYIMNSKDLRAVEHVHRLTQMGINCLKIEGRTKSHYYVARTTQVYRKAIDAAVAGEAFNPNLLGELEHLANRGYTDGFFERHASQELQNYREGASIARGAQFVAEVMGGRNDIGLYDLVIKNRLSVGDEVELLTPEGNCVFQLEELRDQYGRPLESAPGSGWQVQAQLPMEANEMGLLTRIMS